MKKDKIVYPSFDLNAFNCPHCGVYAHQKWDSILFEGDIIDALSFKISKCEHCGKVSIWAGYGIIQQVFPDTKVNVEPPNEDLNDVIKRLYNEAAEIKDKSPRAAAALLRLALRNCANNVGGAEKI